MWGFELGGVPNNGEVGVGRNYLGKQLLEHMVENGGAVRQNHRSVRGVGYADAPSQLGEKVDARGFLDASAAKHMIEREGFAHFRYTDMNVLRLQTPDVRRMLHCTIFWGLQSQLPC